MKSTRSQATENLIHVLQAPESVAAHEDETLTYTIKDLLVSTAYRAAVACTEESGIQSDWSAEVSGRTLDRGTGGHLIRRQTLCVCSRTRRCLLMSTAPSRPPEVCYRVEKRDSGSLLLHLMWKVHRKRFLQASVGQLTFWEFLLKKNQTKHETLFYENPNLRNSK